MAIVYLITNLLNGKQYVGATIKTVDQRWKLHVKDSLSEKEEYYFHRAIRTHGPENFKYEILCEHPNENYVFDVLEPQYIKQYKTHSTEGGYNTTFGGRGFLGGKHSEKTKNILREKSTGKVCSLETREKIAASKRGKPGPTAGRKLPQMSRKGKLPSKKGILNPNLSAALQGRIMNETEKQKRSLALKGKKRDLDIVKKIKEKNQEKCKVLDSNGIITEVHNMKDFCVKYNLSQSLLSEWKTHKGFKIIEKTKKIRTYEILNTKTHEIITTNDLAGFCRENNMDGQNSTLLKTLDKPSYVNYRGWKLLSKNITEKIIFPPNTIHT